jgi:hypothetical protein
VAEAVTGMEVWLVSSQCCWDQAIHVGRHIGLRVYLMAHRIHVVGTSLLSCGRKNDLESIWASMILTISTAVFRLSATLAIKKDREVVAERHLEFHNMYSALTLQVVSSHRFPGVFDGYPGTVNTQTYNE